MLRSSKFHAFYGIAILSSLFAVCQITKRHPSAQEKPLAGARPQGAAVVPLTSHSPKSAEAQEQDRLRIEVGYGNLPLSFEPNRGQTDPRVKFLSHAGHHTLWLTNDEAVLAMGRTTRSMNSDTKKATAVKENQIAPAVLRMKFVGANISPTIEGEARQPGTVNYFSGKPEQWRTNIPTYARVRYSSLYPGIDLMFYGNNRELEYDLVVAPGADPGQIRLALTGANEIRIDDAGDLVLKTSQGDVIQQKPKIYQRKGTRLTAVAGDYVITGEDEVGFRLGSYDRRSAVVIDPVLRYSTFLGGSLGDNGRAIAVDSSKRPVVIGSACSPDFPGSSSTPPRTECAVFVTKLDFTGSKLVFSAFLENAFFGVGTLDSANNIYVTGATNSATFPITPGAFQTTSGGSTAFVTKLNSTGTNLVYSTFLGSDDQGFGIAVDSSGNAYVTGSTGSADFPTTSGAFQRECKNTVTGVCSAGFVTKLNSNGSRALYSTFLGGHGKVARSQSGMGIAVDRSGHAFVAGFTDASDFPTTAGSAQPVFGGGAEDAFAAQVSSSGSHLIYSTYLGGTDVEFARAVALDTLGHAFVTGNTASTDFPVKNAFQSHCAIALDGCNNAFVTKVDVDGSLVYSTFLGGGVEGDDIGFGIASTPGGQVYVTGDTGSKHFPTTQNSFQRVSGGGRDTFISKFTPEGKLIYSSYLGGNGNDFFATVALDRDANAYLTGEVGVKFNSTGPSTFPVTPGSFQQNLQGASSAFVAKVASLCALSTVNRTVTICSPGNGSTVKSPVRIIAGTTDVAPVKLTQVYLDGKKIYETPLSAINVGLPIPGGTHRLTVQGLDTAGVFFKKSISVNVSPQ